MDVYKRLDGILEDGRDWEETKTTGKGTKKVKLGEGNKAAAHTLTRPSEVDLTTYTDAAGTDVEDDARTHVSDDAENVNNGRPQFTRPRTEGRDPRLESRESLKELPKSALGEERIQKVLQKIEKTKLKYRLPNEDAKKMADDLQSHTATEDTVNTILADCRAHKTKTRIFPLLNRATEHAALTVEEAGGLYDEAIAAAKSGNKDELKAVVVRIEGHVDAKLKPALDKIGETKQLEIDKLPRDVQKMKSDLAKMEADLKARKMVHNEALDLCQLIRRRDRAFKALEAAKKLRPALPEAQAKQLLDRAWGGEKEHVDATLKALDDQKKLARRVAARDSVATTAPKRTTRPTGPLTKAAVIAKCEEIKKAKPRTTASIDALLATMNRNLRRGKDEQTILKGVMDTIHEFENK